MVFLEDHSLTFYKERKTKFHHEREGRGSGNRLGNDIKYGGAIKKKKFHPS